MRERADISREIYFAVLLDRATAVPVIVASTEGGVEIEAVAAQSPEKINREPIDAVGLGSSLNAESRKQGKKLQAPSSKPQPTVLRFGSARLRLLGKK